MTTFVKSFPGALAPGFAFLLAWLPIQVSVAQSVELISLTNLWRYNQSGADLGAEWKEVAYDDSAWPEGRGVLADENSTPYVQGLTNTYLSRIGTNGQYKITDYFRARFTLPVVQPGWFLISSNIVDDGAVIYLNGTELFRIGMPSGPVLVSSLASRTVAVGQEGIFEITNVSAAALVPGENVLAVEVHQPYLTSSDVVLGLALIYVPPDPIAITSQPADLTVGEGRAAGMSIAVAGSLPQFQWWKDSAFLPGATNATLSLDSVLRADAGQYFVIASNEVSAVTSRVATLTVALDLERPRLTQAQEVSPGLVRVSFSERVAEDSATNAADYRLTTRDGGFVSVSIADVFAQGFSASLRLATALTPGTNHLLTASNVRDRFGNVIAPDSGISVGVSVTNVPLESVWQYNDSGIDPGPAWSEPGYDDSAWASGLALFYNDSNFNLQPPGVRRTSLAVTNESGPFWTHYFRLRFTNAASPLNVNFRTRYYLDDGAVFYLNGQEIRRIGMPPGPVSHDTRASSSANEGMLSPETVQRATNLFTGGNVFAVEVHQFSLASPNFPDISFGLQLEADVESFVDGTPLFPTQPADVTVRESEAAVFVAHTAGAESVQWLRNGEPLPAATGTCLTNAPAGMADNGVGFSLFASNSFGTMTSRTARLTVVPDSIAPRLLSAGMGTNVDRVSLCFSEPLDSASASLVGNYTITNEFGGTLVLLSATLTNGTNVILTTSPRAAGRRYIVTVNGVSDVSAAGNLVLSNGHTGIDYEALLFTYNWVWRYDDSGTNLGTLWREPGYDDSAWPSGPGLLGFEESFVLPTPIVTVLPPPEFRGPTYYFRTWFQFEGDPSDAIFRLRHVIDDGAVFYLNGQEIHRVRVPAGQNSSTLAVPAIADGTLEGPFLIPTGALLLGVNVLAAEVHQNSTVSADVVFGAELVQAFPANPSAPVGPTLEFHPAGESLALFWDDLDFVLECATQASGPWSTAVLPTLPYSVSPTNGTKFYRLRAENR